jgi:hypothetical protein
MGRRLSRAAWATSNLESVLEVSAAGCANSGVSSV